MCMIIQLNISYNIDLTRNLYLYLFNIFYMIIISRILYTYIIYFIVYIDLKSILHSYMTFLYYPPWPQFLTWPVNKKEAPPNKKIILK